MNKYLSIIIVVLGIVLYFMYNYIQDLRTEVSNSMNNVKATLYDNDSLQNQSRLYQFQIEELSYYNDSILNKLDSIRKDLNIKDNNVKQLQYLLSISSKTDTIIFNDTLFRDVNLKIDTLIGDKWYDINLKLEYPNIVITTPSFVSEKYIIFSSKKETIKPPKKFFISRWFQRKHYVVEVEVVEENPYIENKQQKFINIIE